MASVKPQGITINGPALAEIRRQAGLTRQAAAKLAGVSGPTWSQYENNTRAASPEAFEAICEALHIRDDRSIRADILGDLMAEMERSRERRNRPVASDPMAGAA